MSLSSYLVILGVLFLTISCKFSESPLYSFMVFDYSKGNMLAYIILSPDEDKIAIISTSSPITMKYHQDIFNFDGGKVCQIDTLINQTLLEWPSKTSGLYYDSSNNSLLKAKSPCASPDHLVDLPQFYTFSSTTFTNSESFIAIRMNGNRLIEYNIGSGKVSRQFGLNNSESQLVREINYSPIHGYLYAFADNLTSQSQRYKVIVFNASSEERINQIHTDLSFLKGLNDGKSFLAYNNGVLYNVDKNGSKKQIWTSYISNDTVEMPFIICTNDNRLLTIRESGTVGNRKYELISYDTEDGSVSQTITLGFIPKLSSESCNDNYLAILDTLGNVHIYKYLHPQPDPDPLPDSFPVWVIILICVGSLLIVGGIVGFIIHKRKQNQKQESYQQFNNEEKSRNDL